MPHSVPPCLIAALASLLIQACASAQDPDKTLYQDFRDKQPLAPQWKMIPPKHEAWTKAEDAGLRVTLPKTRLSEQPVGIRLVAPLAGDFELTCTYELKSADRPPADSPGVGIGFNLISAGEHPKFAKLGRFVLNKEGGVYLAECTHKDMPKLNQRKLAPSATMSGRLKLVRTGEELRFLAADSGKDEFREILRTKFTADDLETVRLGVNNNKSPAGVDAVILDVTLDYGPRPKRPAAKTPQKSATDPASLSPSNTPSSEPPTTPGGNENSDSPHAVPKPASGLSTLLLASIGAVAGAMAVAAIWRFTGSRETKAPNKRSSTSGRR